MVLEGESFWMMHKMKILVALIAVLVALGVYFTIQMTSQCDDYACFQKSMERCSGAKYLNEDTDATWFYDIKGGKNGECRIEVELVDTTAGNLGLTPLKGEKMDCYYPSGISAYPESDLSVCHGQLKEDLQGIIIKKLHVYILQNIGQLNESLQRF